MQIGRSGQQGPLEVCTVISALPWSPLCANLQSGPTQNCVCYMNPVADGQGRMWQESMEEGASLPAAGGSGWLNPWPIASRGSSNLDQQLPLCSLQGPLSVSNHSNSWLCSELTGWEKDNGHGNGRKIREESYSSLTQRSKELTSNI